MFTARASKRTQPGGADAEMYCADAGGREAGGRGGREGGAARCSEEGAPRRLCFDDVLGAESDKVWRGSCQLERRRGGRLACRRARRLTARMRGGRESEGGTALRHQAAATAAATAAPAAAAAVAAQGHLGDLVLPPGGGDGLGGAARGSEEMQPRMQCWEDVPGPGADDVWAEVGQSLLDACKVSRG